MTREEALNKVIGILTYHQVNFCKSKEAVAHMNEIIDALEKIDQEPCEDCISREAVDELSKELVHTTRDKADFLCNFWEGLRKLPPVTPQEPKIGHWIADVDKWGDITTTVNGYRCSECGQFDADSDNYCPNCGCKMESEG